MAKTDKFQKEQRDGRVVSLGCSTHFFDGLAPSNSAPEELAEQIDTLSNPQPRRGSPIAGEADG